MELIVWKEGDRLLVTKTGDRLQLTTQESDFDRAMKIYKQGSKKYENAFSEWLRENSIKNP